MWPTSSFSLHCFGLLVASLLLRNGTLLGSSAERTLGEFSKIAYAAKYGANAMCPLDWMTYKGSCYKLFTDEKPWFEAERSCRYQGVRSHLASILDEEESDVVAHLILKHPQYVGFVWIGLFDHIADITQKYVPNQKRDWWWIDAYKVKYTSWTFGAPTPHWLQYCVYLWQGSGFTTWKNNWCNVDFAYLCKYELKYQ